MVTFFLFSAATGVVFNSPSQVSVEENSERGSTVTVVTVSSPDTFSLTLSQSPPAPAFQMDISLPTVALKSPSNEDLDFEQTNSYSLVFR